MFEKKNAKISYLLLTVVLQGPLGFLTETLMMFQNYNNFLKEKTERRYEV